MIDDITPPMDATEEPARDTSREWELDRELHHFETEQAITEALAVLDGHERGEDDRLERIFRAQNILRAALAPESERAT